MSRRGDHEEIYEERGYYTDAPPRPRNHGPQARIRERDSAEMESSRRREREDPRRSQPEFIRRQYLNDEDEQPLVLRKREVETFTRPVERPRSPSPEPERVKTRIITRERVREPSDSPPAPDRTRMRIVGRERRYSSSSSPPPERRSGVKESRIVYERSQERERERSPESVKTRTRIVEKERERFVAPPRSTRGRERSPPLLDEERIEITRTSRRRSPSPESSSSSSGVAEPPIIRAPPIHQEIITHHRHIDHGYDYEFKSSSPPPPPQTREPKPARQRGRDIDIDIKTGRGATDIEIHESSRDQKPQRRKQRREERSFEEDRIIESTRGLDLRANHKEHVPDDLDEAEYYARKVEERAYTGEAYHGATKDWAIVDVPPGTQRVRMDGIGGGAQEISWQKYNGVRRSKFLFEREQERGTLVVQNTEMEEIEPPRRRSPERGLKEYKKIEININDDRRVGRAAPPPRARSPEMWTEVTKDLIVEEAISELGYDYSETEFFYYIFKFLRYEDVQELVDLSESIKRDRAIRIREIAWERERAEREDREAKEQKKREKREAEHRKEREPERGREQEREHEREVQREKEWREERERRRMPAYEDERIIEREVVWDGGRRFRRYEY